jgi:hypothetical protein
MATSIQKCSCNHPDQDKIYGHQIRLHNLSQKNESKCTVCGSLKKTVVEKK